VAVRAGRRCTHACAGQWRSSIAAHARSSPGNSNCVAGPGRERRRGTGCSRLPRSRWASSFGSDNGSPPPPVAYGGRSLWKRGRWRAGRASRLSGSSHLGNITPFVGYTANP